MDFTKSIYLVVITLLLSGVETQNTKKEIPMAQQMLNDMGLNQRPDIKNVSVSFCYFSNMSQLARKFKIVLAKKFVKSNKSKKFFLEIAFLADLNFFPVPKLIFGHF